MYQQIGSFKWSNPSHVVNRREMMRQRALHIVAGKHRDFEGFWRIVEASFEEWTEGEWRKV